MPSRDASAHWEGPLQTGTAAVTLEASNLGPYPFSLPTRTGDPDGQTSPEELVAAGHASCLAMNLSATLGREDLVATSIDVSSEVTLGEDPAGGYRLTGVAVTLTATVPGVTAERFAELAATAERTCPISKALAGTTITLDASLVA